MTFTDWLVMVMAPPFNYVTDHLYEHAIVNMSAVVCKSSKVVEICLKYGLDMVFIMYALILTDEGFIRYCIDFD